MTTYQEAMAGLTDPNALRQAILARLNINPGQYGANQIGGLGANADFDRTINELYQKGAETSANLDRSESEANTNYERSMTQAALDRDRALQGIRNNFASRGMSFSSANVDELGRANDEFTRYTEGLGDDRKRTIGDIGQRRLSLIDALAQGRQTAEQGFGSDISGFLNDQAVAAWNAALQAAQQQQLAAAMRPPPAINRTTIVQAPRPPAPRLPAVPQYPVNTTTPYQRPTQQVLRGQGYGGKQF